MGHILALLVRKFRSTRRRQRRTLPFCPNHFRQVEDRCQENYHRLPEIHPLSKGLSPNRPALKVNSLNIAVTTICKLHSNFYGKFVWKFDVLLKMILPKLRISTKNNVRSKFRQKNNFLATIDFYISQVSKFLSKIEISVNNQNFEFRQKK